MADIYSFWATVSDLVRVISHLRLYPSHSVSDHLRRAGSGRFAHSLRVGYLSFLLSRLAGCDFSVCARAGVLHDVGYDVKGVANPLRQLLSHAEKGAELARSIGEPYAVVEAIRTHMFPLGEPPRTAGSFTVWFADKVDAFFELFGLTRLLDKLILKSLEDD
ncbi:MAG: HD domain-containing protein [Candidatus Freyarchaeota archaeon]|nr:HD domain-containing protein [Candidatus Jordarchaeia archaeon]